MLSNYLRTAWRILTRNSLYSLTNIFGLAIGLGSLVLISLFVADELSWETMHQKRGQIHYVASELDYGSGPFRSQSTPIPLGRTLLEEIPEVEEYVTTSWPLAGRIETEWLSSFDENRIIMATPDFFRMFSFELTEGDPATVLDRPHSAVITRSTAKKYFGGEHPVGQTLKLENGGEQEFTVTGVAEDIPGNSYFAFDVVATLGSLPEMERNRDDWGANSYFTLVTVRPGTEWDDIEPSVDRFAKTYTGEDSGTRYFSVALPDLYLSGLFPQAGFRGQRSYLYIFGALAFAILALACINYMNLTTARATRRAKEIGIRKAIGAGRGQLIRQFMGEGILMVVPAFLLGLLLAELSLPWFNIFINNDLQLDLSANPTLFAGLFGVALLTGVLSALYPALVLSGYRPAGVFNSRYEGARGSSGLRRLLVVSQFAVSTFLIVSTLVVINQLDYMTDRELGFDQDRLIYIPAFGLQNSLYSFREEAARHSAVEVASMAYGVPGSYNKTVNQSFDPDQPGTVFSVRQVMTDDRYLEALGLELVAGRYFDSGRGEGELRARVINEAMVRQLGWESTEQAVGRTMVGGFEVVGVVKDFHFQSFRNDIAPVVFDMLPTAPGESPIYGSLAVRYREGELQSLLPYLEEKWQNLAAGEPMPYRFLDDLFAGSYESERRLGTASTLFAGIAILIACLGLLGLAVFSAERRRREIAIRKVFGASVTGILGKLNWEFLRQIGLGYLLAVPVSMIVMNRWLSEFAYRIELGAGILSAAAILLLVVAMGTVSWQIVRTARTNPVESLRSE